MKPRSESLRLTETGAADDLELAAAIRAVRAERASSHQVDALAQRLAPQFAAPPVSASALPAAAWSKWLVSLALAFGLSLWATLQLGRPSATPVASSASQPARVAPAARVVPVAPVAEPPAALVIAEPPPPAAPPLPPRAARVRPQARVAAPPTPVAPSGNSNAEAELALLGRAQRTLEAQPSQALALTEQHASTYPRGLFVQEREMLAIQALLKLQRRSAAVARAERFLADYPTSPHARHVRPLLERGE